MQLPIPGKKKEDCTICDNHLCFSPESYGCVYWQVFWLVPFRRPSHPQERTVAKGCRNLKTELTATGIAPDLHRIPFSSRHREKVTGNQ